MIKDETNKQKKKTNKKNPDKAERNYVHIDRKLGVR